MTNEDKDQEQAQSITKLEALRQFNIICGYIPQNEDHGKAIAVIVEALLCIYNGHWFFDVDYVKTAFRQLGVLRDWRMIPELRKSGVGFDGMILVVAYQWHEHYGQIELQGTNTQLDVEDNKKHCISSAIVFLSKFIPFAQPRIDISLV